MRHCTRIYDAADETSDKHAARMRLHRKLGHEQHRERRDGEVTVDLMQKENWKIQAEKQTAQAMRLQLRC